MSYAKHCCQINPCWSKSYFRVGKCYKTNKVKNKLFDEEKTSQTYNLQYIEMSYEETLVRDKKYFPNYLAKKLETDEEREEYTKYLTKIYPGFDDVCMGHKWRDGFENKPPNIEKAMNFYRKAIEKNNAEAMFNSALLLQKSDQLTKNYSLAKFYLKKAANCPPMTKDLNGRMVSVVGVAESQQSLTTIYSRGHYEPRDVKKALY